MKLYLLSDWRPEDGTAYKKAPDDVSNILLSHGAKMVEMPVNWQTGCLAVQYFRLKWIMRWVYLFATLKRRSAVIVQWPNFPFLMGNFVFKTFVQLCRMKRLRIVTLVHDIGRESVLTEQTAGWCHDLICKMLYVSDVVIVHNRQMREWLSNRGFEKTKFVELEIFDYLAPGFEPEEDLTFEPNVYVAGNLTREKAGYVYELCKYLSVNWKLFGKGYEPAVATANVYYGGIVNADDLPSRLGRGFGLIWDGPSSETCEGVFGEYMRINSPHKLSLYLAAGLPVIIWSGAAQADFVRKYEVGFAVDSLTELEQKLANVAPEWYAKVKRNALAVSSKLRSGVFTMRAISAALSSLETCHA